MRATSWAFLLVSIAVVSGASRAAALDKTPPAASAAKVREEVLRTAEAKLESGDEPAIRQALASLGDLGGDAAAHAVVARLRRGLPPQLIEAAIDTLVLLNRPSLAPPLLELTQHRRTQIRVKAMQALAALKMKSAQSALLYALDDPSSEVRGAAVEALAAVGNSRALPALYTAAERDVPGAWQAIGTIATPADVKGLVARAQTKDVVQIRPALDALLARTNLPLDAKLRMVQQVRSLGSPSARACLVEWLAASKTAGDPRLRKALLDSVARFDKEHPQLMASGAH
jgi:HEAT repeat protein